MLFTVAEHPFHSPILEWKRNGRLYGPTATEQGLSELGIYQ